MTQRTLNHVNLDNIGNVPQDYKHEGSFVGRTGLATSERLALKLYEIRTDKEEAPFVNTGEFFVTASSDGRIRPDIGMGFALVLPDLGGIIQTVIWPTVFPVRLSVVGYHYDKGAFSRYDGFDSLFLSGVGVAAHETEAWLKYLNSKHTPEDKQAYLDNFLSRSTRVS